MGEIMACDGAMRILQHLTKPYYMYEIATTLHMRASLVIHHVKKMVQLELLDVVDSDIYKTVFKKNKRIKNLYSTKPGVLKKIEELTS